jgi:predicted MFS family arabinose efflux permease
MISPANPSPARVSSTQLPRPFVHLTWSALAALSADQIGLAATPIIAVLVLGAGAGTTGLLQTAQTLPFLLLAIPAGLVADRAPRRMLMLAGEVLRLLSLLAILVAVETEALNVALLALLGFIGATGTVAYSVAAPALVPTLVGRGHLVAANGRLELMRSGAFAAGPALGGALVGWIGAAPAFAVAALLSAAAVCWLSRLVEPARAPSPSRRPLHEIAEGARFAFGHKLLRPILITAVFFNIAFFMQQAVYVPYAIHRLGFSASGVGITMAAYGVGMVAAALGAPRILQRMPFGTAIAIGPLTGLAAALLMALTLAVPSMALAAASFFLIGAGPILWVIATTTLRQLVTPARLLGRVSALITTATFGARPVGAALGALIGGTYGAPYCLMLAVAGFLIQALVILASPAVRLTEQPEPVV